MAGPNSGSFYINLKLRREPCVGIKLWIGLLASFIEG